MLLIKYPFTLEEETFLMLMSSLYTPDEIYVNSLSLLLGDYPSDWLINIYS